MWKTSRAAGAAGAKSRMVKIVETHLDQRYTGYVERERRWRRRLLWPTETLWLFVVASYVA